jgi:hypothetical protein
MAASFPASYDALTNPTAGSLLTSPSHADQHINANDIVEAIEQRVGLSGSGFPGTPSSGQFFHHTTRRLDYFYNGTRWLTTHLYDTPIVVSPEVTYPLSATGIAFRAAVPHAGVYDLWLEDFQATFYVSAGTALGASHKWVCVLSKEPAATTVATINIDSGASDVFRNSGQIAIDALVGTTQFEFQIESTKTGTPGTLRLMPTLTYRMVG